MSKTLEAVFDGEVFRPVESPELEPDTRVRLTIETDEPKKIRTDEANASNYPLTALLNLAVDMGVADLASGHDTYAHGRVEDNGDSNK